MKIKRNTHEQLIVENNPIWLAVFFMVFSLALVLIGFTNLHDDPATGWMFIGAGVFFAFVFNMAFIRRSQLILDRPRSQVELRRRSWFGYSRQRWDLQYLSHAITETSYSRDTNTHRAALVISGGMDAGTFPVTITFSSGRAADRAMNAINDWLDTKPPLP